MPSWIVRLLSIGVAFGYSVLVVAFWPGPLVNPMWAQAPGQLYRLETSSQLARLDVEVTVEKLDDWLAGDSSREFADAMGIRPDPDPWGQPYRCVESRTTGGSGFVFYSNGQDGVSNSAGDDPDDINSWNESKTRYYERQWRWRSLLINLVWAVVLTPFVYAFGGMLSTCFDALFLRAPKDVRSV